MIKNLLNADEDPPPGTKVIVEETVLNPPTDSQNIEPFAETLETRQVFELPEDAKFFVQPSETTDETAQFSDRSATAEPVTETLNEESINQETPEVEAGNSIVVEESNGEKKSEESSGTLFQSDVKPQSAGETIRQSGLAYSAALVLFGSVVFMMILGWFADLLLGSSPWGIVGGIFLGGIIGFIQFFRITSQIFKK